MSPEEAKHLIRQACFRRPDLRYRDWPDTPESIPDQPLPNLMGFCYVASHAFCQLIPEAEVWTIFGGSHYWNVIDGEIWDLTACQFNYNFQKYGEGYKVPRKNKPSKRVKELLEEINEK